MIPSNISAETYYTYYCKDQEAIKYYEDNIKPNDTSAKKEIAALQKTEELLRAQLFNATETLDTLESYINHYEGRSVKELKAKVLGILQDSMFER